MWKDVDNLRSDTQDVFQWEIGFIFLIIFTRLLSKSLTTIENADIREIRYLEVSRVEP